MGLLNVLPYSSKIVSFWINHNGFFISMPYILNHVPGGDDFVLYCIAVFFQNCFVLDKP